MSPFDLNEFFRENLEENTVSNIPEALKWEHMAPDIYAGLKTEKERRRRLLLQKNFVRGILLLLLLIGPCTMTKQILNISSFPIYQAAQIIEKPLAENIIEKEGTPKNTVVKEQPFFKKSVLSHPNKKKIETVLVLTAPQKLAAETPTDDDLHITSGIQKRDAVASFEALPFLFSTSKILEREKELRIKTTSNNLIRQTPGVKVSKWSIGLYGGVSRFRSNYSGAEATFGDLENNLTGFNTGIRVQRHLKGKYSITLGLEYERLRYRFNRNSEDQVKLFRPQTVDTIFIGSITGDTTFVYKDYVDGKRITEVQQFNYHTSVNLPILLSYRLVGHKLGFNINAGMNLRYLQQSTGITATANSTLFDIEEETIYKRSVLIGGLMEAQIEYHLFNRMAITGNFGLEKSFSNWINQTDLNFNSRPVIYGARLGLKYQL